MLPDANQKHAGGDDLEQLSSSLAHRDMTIAYMQAHSESIYHQFQYLLNDSFRHGHMHFLHSLRQARKPRKQYHIGNYVLVRGNKREILRGNAHICKVNCHYYFANGQLRNYG